MVEGGDYWYCARASGHELLVRAVPRYIQEFGVAPIGFLPLDYCLTAETRSSQKLRWVQLLFVKGMELIWRLGRYLGL